MRGVSPLRFACVLAACSLLGLPFVLVACTASGFVDPVSRAAVDVLLRLSAPLQTQPEPQPVDPDDVSGGLSDIIPAATKAPAQPRGAKVSRPRTPAPLFVSAATVLKLSQGAARPSGAFVAATPSHPAGLRLAGVAALGIGVQDGDILIEALGVPPRSAGQIIGAIIEARAKQARYSSGTLWRQGQTFRITVEQPYPTERARAGGQVFESP